MHSSVESLNRPHLLGIPPAENRHPWRRRMAAPPEVQPLLGIHPGGDVIPLSRKLPACGLSALDHVLQQFRS